MTELREEFKVSLGNDYNPSVHDDYYLERFLTARNNNLEKATAMFKSALEWRKTEKVDELADEFVFPEMARVMKIWPRVTRTITLVLSRCGSHRTAGID